VASACLSAGANALAAQILLGCQLLSTTSINCVDSSFAAALCHDMAEEWIIRVQGREYGPVDFDTLREWKREGRLLPQNPARAGDADLWMTAAEIPGLFETAAPRLQAEMTELRPHRAFAQIVCQTLRIYAKGFFTFWGLTLLVVGPSICAQFAGALIESAPNLSVDLRKLLEGGFAFCMLLLGLVMRPIYIASIQILAAELAGGDPIGFLKLLKAAVKFWPRVAVLCLFVYGSYVFWTVLLLGFVLGIALTSLSLASISISLLALAFWVWIIGRLWVNFLFWQQFAVLDGCEITESLRRSKELARSGGALPRFRRPLWSGVFIASLWFTLLLAINWPMLLPYFQTLTTATDPQALMEALKTAAKSSSTSGLAVAFWLLQKTLQPLLGIAFVLLYFDSKIDIEG